ncbi:hypothetical protein [Arthrobacter wenxiniae]|uniref:Uncharacterized protein n=1 Tax=Arthrobacter wenxiniae TaxID=2713570 RepID=A0A7Y7IJD3_9MICC|nr:hypothetical protein [Arthrobacter wenxiniae]NVM96557.1 hypothetical protein [Arthrobacter wenxiniae]
MADTGGSIPSRRTVRVRRMSIACQLTAAGLFVVPAALQFVASLQRGVWFSGSRAPAQVSIEDHRFDYYRAWDPWEHIGTAGQFFGSGILLQVLGLLAMAAGVLAQPVAAARRVTAAALAAVESVLVLLVAATFGVIGTHALVSGMNGTPSQLQGSSALFRALMVVGSAGLVSLGPLWRAKLRAAMAACAFRFGSTVMGYLIATYVMAPVISGGQHDTAPGPETVVAASTGLAGVAMLFAVSALAGRGPAVPPAFGAAGNRSTPPPRL